MSKSEEQTLRRLAESETDLSDWLKKNKEDFVKALGLHCDDTTLILMLAKLPDFVGGHWPGGKDFIDSTACNVLTPFLHGQKVDLAELRTAVALLIQRFNAACTRIYNLDRQPEMHPRPPYRHAPR